MVERVPRGRVTTYAEVGDELQVAPRHVAYLLSRLTPHERDHLPWHRVVPSDGRLPSGARGEEQRSLLAVDGVLVGGDGRLDLDRIAIHVPLDEQHRASESTPLDRAPETESGVRRPDG